MMSVQSCRAGVPLFPSVRSIGSSTWQHTCQTIHRCMRPLLFDSALPQQPRSSKLWESRAYFPLNKHVPPSLSLLSSSAPQPTSRYELFWMCQRYRQLWMYNPSQSPRVRRLGAVLWCWDMEGSIWDARDRGCAGKWCIIVMSALLCTYPILACTTPIQVPHQVNLRGEFNPFDPCEQELCSVVAHASDVVDDEAQVGSTTIALLWQNIYFW